MYTICINRQDFSIVYLCILLFYLFNMSCVVPGCKSNYRKENAYTSVFSFPTDNDTREMWFRAIPRRRKDYEMNKYLKVVTTI